MASQFWRNLRHFFLTSIAFIIGAVCLMVTAYFSIGFLVGSGDEILVPNVIGEESGFALEIILEAGLQPGMPVEEDYHDEIEFGHITEQDPIPGSHVKGGRNIRLVRSLGSQKVKVPSLIGLDLQGTEWELRRSGLRLGHIIGVHHDVVETGLIISQDPLSLTLAIQVL